MLQKLSPREKKMLKIMILGLLIFAFYLIVLHNFLPDYIAAAKESTALRQGIAGMQQDTAKLQTVKRQKNELKAQLQELQQQTGISPTSGESYLALLDQIPDGLQLAGIYPGEISVIDGNLTKLPLKLIADGSQQQIEELLHRIENLPSRSTIEKISLSNSDYLLHLELELTLYGSDENRLANVGRIFKEIGKLNAFDALIRPTQETTGGPAPDYDTSVSSQPAANKDEGAVKKTAPPEETPAEEFVLERPYSFPLKQTNGSGE